jgi:hypothetical protein
MLLTRSGLSKSKIISLLQCEKKLWMSSYKKDDASHELVVSSRMESGTTLGTLARELFPGGSLVENFDPSSAEVRTKLLLQKKAGPIYEAMFIYNDIQVFIDILVPEKDGYHLIEIKSSTKVRDQHIIDAAIQTWVAKKAGLKINRTSVGCINNLFVYPGGGDYDGLFYLTDVTNDVSKYSSATKDWIKSARETLSKPEPSIPMGSHCKAPYRCEFEDYCKSLTPNLPIYPLRDLRLKKSKQEELESRGYTDLLEVPINLIDDPKKVKLHQSILSGENYVSDNAKKEIEAIAYPRYYLDFETIASAIPIWPGTAPYAQIPFQWSCHIEHSDGDIEHKEFLAEPNEDPQEACMKSLMNLFHGFKNGSMIAYNAGFEKKVLHNLASLYPESQALFNGICNKTYDLLPFCRSNFYNRDMHGSWSIKHVLPAIAPDLNYQALEIADGQMAQTAFVKMCVEGLSGDEIVKLRSDLLKYCKLDTLAMVKIVRYFCERP